MPDGIIRPPIVQVAIDVLDIDSALRVAEAAVKAGVDWLEVGTPLVTFAGTAAIGALARTFPHMPILCDYKAMDGTRKYVLETKKQGGHIATVCAVATDASIRTAIEAGKEVGITVISDLYAARDLVGRAREVEAMGVDSLMVHWGADQRNADPSHDGLSDLRAVVETVNVPVAVATWSMEDGAWAIQQGASIVVIGAPLIQADDVEAALREYAERVREAWAAGSH